jgi:hypothetical protein
MSAFTNLLYKNNWCENSARALPFMWLNLTLLLVLWKDCYRVDYSWSLNTKQQQNLSDQ